MAFFKRDKASDAGGRAPFPFVVGMNRSGTTLLRMMLDAHPDLTLPPETHFLPTLIKAAKANDATPELMLEAMKSHREWGDFDFSDDEVLGWFRGLDELDPGAAARCFYEAYAKREGKPRYGEKTPKYVRNMPLIQRALPEARFVHVIRDGRDVALSVMDRTVREHFTHPLVIERWRKKVVKAQDIAPRLNHYIEIRYEDLILDTEPVLRKVCDFIELDYDPQMLTYHLTAAERLAEMARDMPETERRPARPGEDRLKAHALTTEPPKKERIGVWRNELDEADQVAFESVAHQFLTDLGYELSGHELRDPEEYAEQRQAEKIARREARQAERAQSS